jgi:hypothetical protein
LASELAEEPEEQIMKRSIVVTSLAFGLCVVVVGLSGLAAGAVPAPAPTPAKSGAAAKPAAPETPAPAVPSLATLLDGFKWGVNHTEVTKMHNQVNGVFDREYNPMLVKMQPGTRMQAVEAERETKKIVFQNSFLEFKETPLGYDTTGLKGEYSYKNHEYVQVISKEGRRRFFFYIGNAPGDRLWKIYDEVKLGEGGPYGKSYQEAVLKMNATLGVAGRARNADPEKGIGSKYTEWADASTHLRVVDRSGEGTVGIVLEDKATLGNLGSLRANKIDDPMSMDPSITAITRGGISDPNAKPPASSAPDAGAKPPTPPKKK